MRRSSVVVFLMCALSPFRAVAQVYTAEGVIAGPTPNGATLEVASPGGLVALEVQAAEGTGIKAFGATFGLDATGYIYGARINGGLQLVPGTGGIIGSEWGPPEAGLLFAGEDGTLWYRTKSATPTNPGTVIALSRQVPPGAISAYAGASAPEGYLFCKGQAVSRTTYAALFGAIGTTYGAGDGSTTFNVPDLRGDFLRGLDAGRGVDAGRVLGTEQPDAMQGHKHMGGAMGQFGPYPWGTTPAGQNINVNLQNGQSGWAPLTSTPVADGTNGTPRSAGETRPRNVAVNYIIAY